MIIHSFHSFGLSEKDPTKDRGKILTTEIDRGKDRVLEKKPRGIDHKRGKNGYY